MFAPNQQTSIKSISKLYAPNYENYTSYLPKVVHETKKMRRGSMSFGELLMIAVTLFFRYCEKKNTFLPLFLITIFLSPHTLLTVFIVILRHVIIIVCCFPNLSLQSDTDVTFTVLHPHPNSVWKIHHKKICKDVVKVAMSRCAYVIEIDSNFCCVISKTDGRKSKTEF